MWCEWMTQPACQPAIRFSFAYANCFLPDMPKFPWLVVHKPFLLHSKDLLAIQWCTLSDKWMPFSLKKNWRVSRHIQIKLLSNVPGLPGVAQSQGSMWQTPNPLSLLESGQLWTNSPVILGQIPLICLGNLACFLCALFLTAATLQWILLLIKEFDCLHDLTNRICQDCLVVYFLKIKKMECMPI